MKSFRERVAKHADLLFDYQFTLARGCTVLYRVEKDKQGNDKSPVMVTDQSEVMDYLAGKLKDGKYRFITTEKPDNRAIDSLLDRTFGKADSKIDLTSQASVSRRHLSSCRPSRREGIELDTPVGSNPLSPSTFRSARVNAVQRWSVRPAQCCRGRGSWL